MSSMHSFLSPSSIRSILVSEAVACVTSSNSDITFATLNDVIDRREWTSSDHPDGQNGRWLYLARYSDEHTQWLHRGHPDEQQQPRLFDVVDRFKDYVALSAINSALPKLSLGDFKKADLVYNRRIGAHANMDCVENAVRTAARLLGLSITCSSGEVDEFLRTKSFSTSTGLDSREAKQFVDWLMKHGFKIQRDVYNKSLVRGRSVDKDKFGQICNVLQAHGPGVYIVYTSDVSLMGHYWTVRVFRGIAVVESEVPRCFIDDMEDFVHHVHFIRKCVKH